MEIGIYRSDIQELIEKIQMNRGKDPEATIADCRRLEEYGTEHREAALVGFARFTRGETYYMLNDMANFYREMIMCIDPFERIHEWGYLAMANNMLGIMSLNRGNAPFALDYYFKAITYCEEYKLRDLEWMIRINMGTLYLSVENSGEAEKQLRRAEEFLVANKNMPGIHSSMAAVYVGLGKAALIRQDYDAAQDIYRRLETEHLLYLQQIECLPAYCLGARIAEKVGDEDRMMELVRKVRETFREEVPIMDVFDDIYDYMGMLLDIHEYGQFFLTYERMEELTGKTMVRNLEKKLLGLKIRYFRDCDDKESYRDACTSYYETVELMERENEMMVSSMITMRGSFYDLASDHKRVEDENRRLQLKSETDPLTRMYNRLKLNEYGEIAFDRAVKNKVGIAIEILDIDFFKEYNDNYGHQKGDECIKFIADCILSLKRHSGVFCSRYGGDEFVIIYEGYTDKEVFAIAKELKKKVVDGHFVHAHSRSASKFVTISQGIFWSIPEKEQTLWNFLHEADNLLYKVKTRSRNSIMLGTIMGGAQRSNDVMSEDGDSFTASGRDVDPEKARELEKETAGKASKQKK